jgi:hypothetical protein
LKSIILTAVLTFFGFLYTASSFEGRIAVSVTRGGDTEHLLYTVGTNFLRIECPATNQLYPSDIVDTKAGEVTLVYSHNHSFVRFSLSSTNVSSGLPQMHSPTGMSLDPGAGNFPGTPGPVPAPQAELVATGDMTNLLGYACERYEIQQHGETMEIWATTALLPFQRYLPNQPPQIKMRLIEERWSDLLKNEKVFPLLAVLKFQNGIERLHFEVTAIEPAKIEDKDRSLSQPPPGYYELQSLPF